MLSSCFGYCLLPCMHAQGIKESVYMSVIIVVSSGGIKIASLDDLGT